MDSIKLIECCEIVLNTFIKSFLNWCTFFSLLIIIREEFPLQIAAVMPVNTRQYIAKNEV